MGTGNAALNAGVVAQLREKIRKLEAQPRELVMALRTGWEALDELGVFRLGGGVELCGEEASGRTTVALSVVAAAGREKRLSAWVDGPSELYPPAAVSLGVDLKRLLIVRPKSSGQLVWSAMQLLRSGAFTCVVLDVTHTGLRLTMTDTKKLLDAARTGGSALVLLTSALAPAQGLGRLMLQTSEVSAQGVSFTFQTPHGRHAVLRGPRFRGRLIVVPWAAPDVPSIAPRVSLQRPKRNLLRDGYPMAWMHPRESHHQVAPALAIPAGDRGRRPPSRAPN